MKKEKRSIHEVTNCLLFPFTGLGGNPETEARVAAVASVLQRIPEKAYRALCEKADEFEWFIPETCLEAMVKEFPCTVPETNDLVARAKILYLSPDLEFRDSMFAIAVVAHELAHIFLNHNAGHNTEENYDGQERDAWRTVEAWGFQKEKRAYEKIREKEAREDKRAVDKIQRVLKGGTGSAIKKARAR
jgi:hypothetical protein